METPKSEYDDITPVVAPAALFTNHSAGVHTPPGSPELLKQDRRVNRCKLSHLGIVLCFSAMVAGCVVIASEMFGVSNSVQRVQSHGAHNGYYGVCYSPFHHRDYGRKETIRAVLQEDFAQIRQYFTLLRSYYSNFLGVNVAQAVEEAGLRVALGITMTVWSQPYAYRELEIQSAIHGAIHHPDSIESIYVGNENLRNPNGQWGSVPAEEIIQIIHRVRGGIAGSRGQHIPVGTVQRINEWLVESPEVDWLANECDVIGVNIYPFFTPGDMEQIPKLQDQWDMIFGRFPQHGHKIRLTETGYPTEGTAWFNNVPGWEPAKKYFEDYTGWQRFSDRPSYYFKFYDERYPTMLDVDRYFGLANEDGILKFPLDAPEPQPTEAPKTEKPDSISDSRSSEDRIPPTTIFNTTNMTTTWFCADPTGEDLGLTRTSCSHENLCSTNEIQIHEKFYCCHEYIGELCPTHLTLAWSSCNVSDLSNYCPPSDGDPGQSTPGTWVCQAHPLGIFSRENCEFAHIGALQSNNQVACCSINGTQLESTEECPESLHAAWTSCNFGQLELLIRDSESRREAELNEPPVDKGEWYCRHAMEDSYRIDHCSSVHCALDTFMDYRCCPPSSGVECNEHQAIDDSNCASVVPQDLCDDSGAAVLMKSSVLLIIGVILVL